MSYRYIAVTISHYLYIQMIVSNGITVYVLLMRRLSSTIHAQLSLEQLTIHKSRLHKGKNGRWLLVGIEVE